VCYGRAVDKEGLLLHALWRLGPRISEQWAERRLFDITFVVHPYRIAVLALWPWEAGGKGKVGVIY
jgi:hypothetical protein